MREVGRRGRASRIQTLMNLGWLITVDSLIPGLTEEFANNNQSRLKTSKDDQNRRPVEGVTSMSGNQKTQATNGSGTLRRGRGQVQEPNWRT